MRTDIILSPQALTLTLTLTLVITLSLGSHDSWVRKQRLNPGDPTMEKAKGCRCYRNFESIEDIARLSTPGVQKKNIYSLLPCFPTFSFWNLLRFYHILSLVSLRSPREVLPMLLSRYHTQQRTPQMCHGKALKLNCRWPPVVIVQNNKWPELAVPGGQRAVEFWSGTQNKARN